MKNIICSLLASISLFLITNAQTTNVPDDNFEQALIDQGYDDVLDNTVLTSNINSVTYLNVSQKSIDDLTGIEAFTALEELICYNNQLLVPLDVSNNTALTYLECRGNNLSILDLNNNLSLTYLDCSDNKLANLIITNNTDLTYLDCSSNQLQFLNTDSNINLDYISFDDNDLTSFNPINNLVLTEITCRNNLLNSINLSNNTSLIHLTCFGNNLTSLILTNNTALQFINCGMNQLTDIDISNNMSLERLNCFSNEISALDISNHAAIYSLNCSSNMMTTLTFNNTPALRSLSCDINQLTNLELNNNLALTDLACFDNQLTSLDLSANIALIGLECDSNLLTELNVQNGNNTNFNFFSATNNPNLTCIQVDDAGYSTTNWNSIDGMVFFSENCATASIEEYQSDKVISYPNPVLNQVTIKSKVSYSNYEIYDYTGKQVKKGIFKGSNINLAYLDSGIYMLKLIDDLNYETVKLIKK